MPNDLAAVPAASYEGFNETVRAHLECALRAASLPDLDQEYAERDNARAAAAMVDKAAKSKGERRNVELWLDQQLDAGLLHEDWRYYKVHRKSAEPVRQDIERRLKEAVTCANAGDVELEEAALYGSLDVARRYVGRSEEKAVAAEIAKLTGSGQLRVGAHHLGTVEPETVFGRLIRTSATRTPVTFGLKVDAYTDRIVQGNIAHRIDAHTVAQVYLDGQMQITQRPTLTRMGLLSWLPGDALMAGLATQKKEKNDSRSAVFLVGSAAWSMQVPIDPDRINNPREIALQINATVDRLAAQQAAPTASTLALESPASAGSTDVLGELERIHNLLQAGGITSDEAQRLKDRLLRE